MSSESPTPDLVNALREAFSDAECEIHKTEAITQKTPVSALNELRYAGSHMLVHLQEENEEELNQAVLHGRRAFFDAQRFMLLFLMRDAQAIRDGMGDYISLYIDLVSKTYGKGKYAQLKKGLLAAKSYIQRMAQIKTDSNRWKKRGETFAACKPHIDALKEYIDVYETISDEFVRIKKDADDAKQAAEARKRAEEQDKHRNFILTVLGLVVTIVIGIATICFAG